jgi:hypothetical protein
MSWRRLVKLSAKTKAQLIKDLLALHEIHQELLFMVKYMRFDLEACAREKRALEKEVKRLKAQIYFGKEEKE